MELNEFVDLFNKELAGHKMVGLNPLFGYNNVLCRRSGIPNEVLKNTIVYAQTNPLTYDIVFNIDWLKKTNDIEEIIETIHHELAHVLHPIRNKRLRLELKVSNVYGILMNHGTDYWTFDKKLHNAEFYEIFESFKHKEEVKPVVEVDSAKELELKKILSGQYMGGDD